MTLMRPIETDYVQRACPSCTTSRSKNEVRSDPPAESLPFDKVRPYWSGLFKEKIFFSYDRCEECGLLFAPAFFADDQLSTLYSAMAPNMADVTDEALEATQRGYFDAVKRRVSLSGSYLEIGPDVGYIVRHIVREARFDHLWLFEPNVAVHDTLAAAATGKPATISTSMHDFSAVPDASVGLAVMIHVLDHLTDPMEILQQVRGKLKSDGKLLIVTHNEASLLRRVMGNRWPPFCLQHPEIYNPRSIAALLKRAGFGSVMVQRSRNVFPMGFMIRQAAWTVRLNLDKVPLPATPIGLRLGNMLTLASA